MNKAVKYGRNGLLIGGVGLGLYNFFEQLERRKKGEKFDFWELLAYIGGGAIVGGGIGLGIGAIRDHINSLEKPVDTDAMLLSILNDIRLDPKDRTYSTLKAKSDWLITILENEFCEQLHKSPYRFGSTENNTALQENYDIDICAPFRPNSFPSIREMFFMLLNVLKEYQGVNDIILVRDQKKSIGVVFSIHGEEKKIDIVPQKLTKRRGRLSSGYLFVNNKGLFEKPSRTKTDIELLSSFEITGTQNKILVWLKKLKENKSLPISSHLLKYLITVAYEENRGHIPRAFTKKIIMVLEYIKYNLEYISVSSIENTNNILTNISDSDKALIVSTCSRIIEDYEYQPNSITKILY